MAALQTELLTTDVAEIFVVEFRREVGRLERLGLDDARADMERLDAIEAKLATLSKNLVAGVIGPIIVGIIAERETAQEMVMRRRQATARPRKADVLPRPAFLRRYEEKIKHLRETLASEGIRDDAVSTIRGLIQSITIHDYKEGSVAAEIAAPKGRLTAVDRERRKPPPRARWGLYQRWLRGRA